MRRLPPTPTLDSPGPLVVCRSWLSEGNQSISSGVVTTVNVTGTVVYDPWGIVDNVNKQFNLPPGMSGYWAVDAILYWQGYNVGSRAGFVRRQDSSMLAQRSTPGTTSDGSSILMPVRGWAWAEGGSWLKLQAWQDSGTALVLQSNLASMFSLEYLGR